MKIEECKDGEYYFISIACSSEGEYGNESVINILGKFHRVMADFTDGKGNISQSPIEWFEDAYSREHFSNPYQIREATFCDQTGLPCLDRGRRCAIDFKTRNGKNEIWCFSNHTQRFIKNTPIKLEGAKDFARRVYYNST